MTEHISTEEAEDIARELDFDCKCFKCSQSPQQVGANTIRSLAAERDELRVALGEALALGENQP